MTAFSNNCSACGVTVPRDLSHWHDQRNWCPTCLQEHFAQFDHTIDLICSDCRRPTAHCDATFHGRRKLCPSCEAERSAKHAARNAAIERVEAQRLLQQKLPL